MKKRLVVVCILVLMVSTLMVHAEATSSSDEECGFFCKVKSFFIELFTGSEKSAENSYDQSSDEVSSIGGEGEGGPPIIDAEVVEPDKQMETESITPPKTVEEIKEEAIEEQIEVVEERAAEMALADITVKNPKCTIDLAKEEAKGNENVKVDITFTDETLKYEKVSISCDQFERYGKSSDHPYKTAVPASLKISDTSCDWGDVTTKTVYFVIVADKDDNDICAAPITILPKKGDLTKLGKNGCFTDEALAEMKQDCGDLKPFSLPDANGCETVYCAGGEISQCTPEPLLEKATIDCQAKGENFLAYKYSEWFEGQDWPCGQIRCSECPSEEELSLKEESCLAQGDDVEPRKEVDYEVTGCTYLVCVPKGEPPLEGIVPPE